MYMKNGGSQRASVIAANHCMISHGQGLPVIPEPGFYFGNLLPFRIVSGKLRI